MPLTAKNKPGFSSRRLRFDRWTLEVYLAAVAVAGLTVLGTVVLLELPALRHEITLEFGMLAGLVLLGELLTIKVPRHDDRITSSTPFMFAILLTSGAPLAMAAQAVASVIADIRERRGWLATAFNIGQQSLAVMAAGLVLGLLSGLPDRSLEQPFVATDLPAMLAAATAFFLVNNLFAGTAAALSTRAGVLETLLSDIGFQVSSAAVFLSLAPIIVVAADYNLGLIIMLVLPLLAIHRGGHEAMLNEHQALHDALTDLPNRLLFSQRLKEAVTEAQRERSALAVLIMDLDHFKEINDTLGHHYGDLLLQQVGPRLNGVLRETDTIARMGGDEFAILLPQIEGKEIACEVAQKILTALHQPFEIDDLTLEVGASIGIACSPQHGAEVEILLQRADVAMFLAKESRDGYQIYSPERDHYSPDRLALAGEMRRAIEAGHIVLHYQPVVELRSGQLIGAEALARWHHPQRGTISPTEFIPIAEQTGLIRPLTMKLLRDALHQLRRWRDAGHDLTVAVNISPRHLLDQDLPDDLAELLDEYEMPANRLKLEITESSIMADPKRAQKVLVRLHAMGIRMSIDDFGTGYSSLTYLKRLPVDEIKIDRSFIMNMATEMNDAQIVRSTIDLGRNLGLGVVAEGVESQDSWDELLMLGCDRVQGYYFSRPLAPDQFMHWADRRRGGTAPVEQAPPSLRLAASSGASDVSADARRALSRELQAGCGPG